MRAWTVILVFGLIGLLSCQKKTAVISTEVRGLVDTVGYAHKSWQMEAFLYRLEERFAEERQRLWQRAGLDSGQSLPMVISPHDDYTYAGEVYASILPLVKAPLVILVGVAHHAARFGVENRLVFGHFRYWHGPWKPVPVSPVQDEIVSLLPDSLYIFHDSLQAGEHSLEALIPFLQYYQPDLRIVPFLVPYMPFVRMKMLARPLAKALARVLSHHHWQWGRDVAIVISTDAVHYGDEGWGGKNFAYYGTDVTGYKKAVAHEKEIIQSCLEGPLREAKIEKFTRYTVQDTDYHEYRWTWCGRYSVPFGLLVGFYLSQELGVTSPVGRLILYRTSIARAPLPVADLGMGATAPANQHHWVGYAAIAYTF